MVITSKIFKQIKECQRYWDHFTRKEEYGAARDQHDRFLYKYSSFSDISEPEVSSYLIQKGIITPEYPRGKNFAICLTHDIDFVYPTTIRLFLTDIYSRKPLTLSKFKRHLNWMKKDSLHHDFLNFEEIMNLESHYGAKSAFFFLNTRKDPEGQTYDIGSISEHLKKIVSNGWEIGLHTGYYSFDDADKITKEKKGLEKTICTEINSVRNHYLRFRVPQTWSILRKAGFSVDSTFGYADKPGFRNGVCHPFKPFDLKNSSVIDILEIPVVVMDTTLFHYMKLNAMDGWDYIRKLIDVTQMHRGVITILWHNTTFLKQRQGWDRVYEWILKYGKKKRAWMTSPAEIFKWVSREDT